MEFKHSTSDLQTNFYKNSCLQVETGIVFQLLMGEILLTLLFRDCNRFWLVKNYIG